VNDGSGVFVDLSARSRLRFATLPFTGFGAAWFDYDNDGWLDILMVSGAVTSIEELMKAYDPFPLRQRKQLLRNLGNGQFEDVTDGAGVIFRQASVARGAAFGDLDNDCDTDVIVASNNGPVQLLINQVGNRNHWIRIQAGTAANGGRPPSTPSGDAGAAVRDALGARVGV